MTELLDLANNAWMDYEKALTLLNQYVDINLFLDHNAPMPKPVTYSTTLHVREQCLCLAAQRSARALARYFDEVLRPVGLTNGQFSLLMSLNRPEPPTINSVANLLVMDRTTLTANIKPLEQRGLLSVAVDPKDKRGRLLSLSDAGRGLLQQALPIWEQSHADIETKLITVNADDLRRGMAELTSPSVT